MSPQEAIENGGLCTHCLREIIEEAFMEENNEEEKGNQVPSEAG
jgi:hypothetical protein